MKHRLYLPPPLEPGSALELDRERAHYLTRVLRLQRGAGIECFDGHGRSFAATLTDASSRSATLELESLLQEAEQPAPPLHLVQGLLKGSAMDLVIQKATELGATDLWPVLAARSNVPGDPARRARKQGHWQRVMESAAEQCGAVHLPRLHPVQRFTDFLAEAPSVTLILMDPDSPPLPLTLPRAATAVLIGPEGGWSEDERRKARDAGAARYGLGVRVLRGETAPLAVLAALRHGWGWC